MKCTRKSLWIACPTTVRSWRMEATSFWTIAKLSPEINKIGYKKKKTSEIKLIFFLLLSHRTVLVIIPFKKKQNFNLSPNPQAWFHWRTSCSPWSARLASRACRRRSYHSKNWKIWNRLFLFHFYPIRQLYKSEIVWVLGKLEIFLISHKNSNFSKNRIIKNTDRTFKKKNLTSLTMETLARMSMVPSLPAPTYSQSNARTGVGGPLKAFKLDHLTLYRMENNQNRTFWAIFAKLWNIRKFSKTNW